MKKYSVAIIIITSLFFSCGKFKDSSNEKSDIKMIFNDLKKDNVYKKFIGFHIVRRGGENQFFYNNLNDSSSSWESPILYKGEGKELPETRLFFEKHPAARLQFDIMIKNSIKAVITYNYNHETNRLEYQEYGGYKFDNYELTFAISDSIKISNINFAPNNYYKIIEKYFQVTEKLDSNWFVLKRN